LLIVDCPRRGPFQLQRDFRLKARYEYLPIEIVRRIAEPQRAAAKPVFITFCALTGRSLTRRPCGAQELIRAGWPSARRAPDSAEWDVFGKPRELPISRRNQWSGCLMARER
jgi:hypothetical protein